MQYEFPHRVWKCTTADPHCPDSLLRHSLDPLLLSVYWTLPGGRYAGYARQCAVPTSSLYSTVEYSTYITTSESTTAYQQASIQPGHYSHPWVEGCTPSLLTLPLPGVAYSESTRGLSTKCTDCIQIDITTIVLAAAENCDVSTLSKFHTAIAICRCSDHLQYRY